MPDSDAGQRYLEMGLGKFLDVVDAMHQWVVPGLSQSGLQHMQDHLSFGSFLSQELCTASRVGASERIGINRNSKPLRWRKYASGR